MLEVTPLPENKTFDYPIARKGKVSGAIVLFYSMKNIVCIKGGGIWRVGDVQNDVTGHETKEV